MHASGVPAASRVLPNAAVASAHLASLLPVLLQPGCHGRLLLGFREEREDFIARDDVK